MDVPIERVVAAAKVQLGELVWSLILRQAEVAQLIEMLSPKRTEGDDL